MQKTFMAHIVIFRLHNTKSGFTLIELSIVIVIIGLIVGSVFVGRDLIKAAEIRGQVTQIEQINSAVNTFRIKYNCLPGDCKNATQFFGATSQPEQVVNGDGNGMICGYCSVPDQNVNWSGTEWLRTYDHLAGAKLISLNPYDDSLAANTYFYPNIGFPTLRIKSAGESAGALAMDHVYRQGGISFGYESAVSYNTGGHRFRLGAGRYYENHGGGWAANIGFGNGINPTEALALDTKIDDGKPYSGAMVLMANFYTYRIPGWSGTALNDTNFCGDYVNNVYRSDTFSTSSPRSCAPSVKAGF